MRSYCEVYVRDVLPSLRLYLAEKLVRDYGLTQLEVSRMLGISQPLVNYVVNKRRKPKMLEKLVSIPQLKDMLDKKARELAARKASFSDLTCDFCFVLRREGLTDQIIKSLNYEICMCANGKPVTKP
ncbi:MAG: transcriptional regulator [Zestosphaera sp.]